MNNKMKGIGMKRLGLCVLLLLAGAMIAGSGCEEVLGETLVRFKNNSRSLTVYPVWDGVRWDSLAPGEESSWERVNPGTHTLQWKNAANGKALTAVGWPNVTKGKSSQYPYNG